MAQQQQDPYDILGRIKMLEAWQDEQYHILCGLRAAVQGQHCKLRDQIQHLQQELQQLQQQQSHSQQRSRDWSDWSDWRACPWSSARCQQHHEQYHTRTGCPQRTIYMGKGNDGFAARIAKTSEVADLEAWERARVRVADGGRGTGISSSSCQATDLDASVSK